MAVRRWPWALLLCIPLVCAPARAQQGSTSDKDLPSAPQPQPGAGEKETVPDAQKSSRPAQPPSSAQAPASQPDEPTSDQDGPPPAQEPPRSAPGSEPGVSSSRENPVDLAPPADDAKTHPNSGGVEEDVGVAEFHPFDPHKAAKDIEVGDFYYKRQNYRAAIERYREALLYKPNDAIAIFSLADSLEKVGQRGEAASNYEAYLKILPFGPKAAEARKGLERLKVGAPKGANSANAAKVAAPKQ
jgi:tetratricopeptide (TPR) repeat protein